MNRKQRQRGSSVLEFGLAFLVFLSIMYGIMEFGRVVASYNILSGAAREGVRYAMVHGSASASPASSSDIQTVVRGWAIGLDAGSVNVTTTWPSGKAPGKKVQVTASYTVVPMSGLLLKDGITVQSSSQMLISQ
jgi:Flp pilus assembly protein TadG